MHLCCDGTRRREKMNRGKWLIAILEVTEKVRKRNHFPGGFTEPGDGLSGKRVKSLYSI